MKKTQRNWINIIFWMQNDFFFRDADCPPLKALAPELVFEKKRKNKTKTTFYSTSLHDQGDLQLSNSTTFKPNCISAAAWSINLIYYIYCWDSVNSLLGFFFSFSLQSNDRHIVHHVHFFFFFFALRKWPRCFLILFIKLWNHFSNFMLQYFRVKHAARAFFFFWREDAPKGQQKKNTFTLRPFRA